MRQTLRCGGFFMPLTNDFCGGYQPSQRPTQARPGSPEKLAVLRSRAAARVALHHPRDCKDYERQAEAVRQLMEGFRGK